MNARTLQFPLVVSDEMTVYFIEAVNGGFIKIGVSRRGRSGELRLRDLQVGCPFTLRLLSQVEGGRSLEARLHQQFRKYHVRGEWFRDVPEIRKYAAEHHREFTMDELRAAQARIQLPPMS